MSRPTMPAYESTSARSESGQPTGGLNQNMSYNRGTCDQPAFNPSRDSGLSQHDWMVGTILAGLVATTSPLDEGGEFDESRAEKLCEAAIRMADLLADIGSGPSTTGP